MRKVFLLSTTLCLAAALASAQNPAPAQRPASIQKAAPAQSPPPSSGTVIEDIIARVNSAIVTRSEFQRAREQTLNDLKQQLGDAQGQAEFAKREKDVLRDLIDSQLLVQKGQDLGVNVDNQVIKELDNMRKQMNLASMEDLEKAAAQQGISYEDYKLSLKNRLITQEVVNREIGSKVWSSITAEEVKKYYDEHKQQLVREEGVVLSEIMVSTEPKKSKDESGKEISVERTPQEIAAAEAKAKQLLAQIKNGAKFEDVAKKDSDGTTAAQGGDLGFFKRGMLAKELEDLTFSMKPGTVSDVIRTKQGFVILKLDEHVPAGIPPLKDVDDQIKNAIYMDRLQPALRDYLTKLREDAFIDIKEGYVDTAASPNETKPVYTTVAEQGAKKLKKKKKFLIF